MKLQIMIRHFLLYILEITMIFQIFIQKNFTIIFLIKKILLKHLSKYLSLVQILETIIIQIYYSFYQEFILIKNQILKLQSIEILQINLENL